MSLTLTGAIKWDIFVFYIVSCLIFITCCCVIMSCLFLCCPAPAPLCHRTGYNSIATIFKYVNPFTICSRHYSALLTHCCGNRINLVGSHIAQIERLQRRRLTTNLRLAGLTGGSSFESTRLANVSDDEIDFA